MTARSVLAALLVVLPCVSLAQPPLKNDQPSSTNGKSPTKLPLGIEAKGTAPLGALIDSGGYAEFTTLLTAALVSTLDNQPTPEQLAAVKALGFSQDEKITIRAYMNATAAEQTDANHADIGIAFVGNGNNYKVKGHVDLTTLANAGQFPRDFAKFLVNSGRLTSAEMEPILRLLIHSTDIHKNAQVALLEMANDSAKVTTSATLGLDSLGVYFDMNIDEHWQNLWTRTRHSINSTLGALCETIDAYDEIDWRVTCDNGKCDVAISGTVSQPRATAFSQELWGSFLLQQAS